MSGEGKLMASADTKLNQIVTLWSVVRQAHTDESEQGRQARQRLLERYLCAIRRYLLGAVRDADTADDLVQDFAIRFLGGALAGADPSRGRFRDFVKGVLFHLVADYHKKKARGHRQFADDAPEPGADCSLAAERELAFAQSWREETLARGWAALQKHEQTQGQPYYTVLRLRAQKPDLSSAQLAVEVSAQLGKEVTAAGVRKTLERARDAYAEFLVEDIAQGLDAPTRERIEEELADLGLLEQCREAVARWHPSA